MALKMITYANVVNFTKQRSKNILPILVNFQPVFLSLSV